MDKKRCQSCGMPLGEGFYGTNLDASDNPEYCKFCYQNGAFTDLSMTVDKMIKMSIENMINEVGLTEEKATELANNFIPQLKRWRR